jgi:hypothetical protein
MAISAYKDVIVFPNDNSGRVNIKEQAFTASGTWTAPSGVTAAQIILVGAGGGGGGGSTNVAGGGGGGGQVTVINYAVTPGTAYQVNIGAGGLGGQSSLTSATDVLSTLPGANGGTTSFGSTTVWNYLTNPDFDYNTLGWDPDVTFRFVTGVSGAFTVQVFPNAAGLANGMYVLGTNLGTNTQISAISGNVLTLTVANAAAVNAVVRFDGGSAQLAPANTTVNAISAPGVDAITGVNTFAVNSAGSPYTNTMTGTTQPQILSNNLMPARYAQLEDPVLVSSGTLLYTKGTNAATISITSAGLPAKINNEMIGAVTTTASASSGATTITVTNAFGIYSNMFITAPSGIATGTYVLAVNGTSITLSTGTTGVLSGSTVYFSYNPSLGLNALLATTGAAVSTANPAWLNFTSINNDSSTTGSTSYVGGYQGIPWIPGQTYTVSAYVSSNLNISTSTPILFQLRSAGWSYMAQTNVNYLGGTGVYTPNTNTIDSGTGNGFFVRQGTAAAMTGYGASVTSTGTGSSGSTQFVVANAAGIYVGMQITAVGVTVGTTVTAITGSTGSQTVTMSAVSTAALTSTSVTFAMPSGVQVLGSTVTTGQNGWRRIYATITTPSISPTNATATNNVYGLGSTPQFIYPTIVLQQASTSFWFDNLQVELGSVPTTWQPPVYQQIPSLSVQSNVNNQTNLETAHRPVRITPNSTYSGSMYVTALGTAPYYQPVTAFIEWMDVDYNVLSRVSGSNNFLPLLPQQTATVQSPNITYPVRIGVSATAPATAVFARLGFSAYQGARGATTAVQYNMFYPVLELGSNSFTQPKRPDGINYFWSGQPGASALISSWALAAEGGGGGGTYNSSNTHWQYGLEGGNNGGHAANGNYGTLTLAGGGGGSFSVGMPGQAWGHSGTNSTTNNPGSNTGSTAGIYSHTFPLRGNLGGFSHTDSGTNAAYISAQGGDGGLGQLISGLTSGSPLGLTLGGGGGGSGWGSSSASLTYPGRGNGGGGKGGGTYIADEYNNQYYFARGLDATPNTGGGGGGGGSLQNNAPYALITHTAAANTLNFENWSQDNYKMTGLYNATAILDASAAIVAGSYGMRVTIGDNGSAKVVTNWQEYPILPRTVLYFPQVGFQLAVAPQGVTNATLFPGLSKRCRPTVRWKDASNTIIREDRPAYDAIFTALSTTTYLGPTSGYTQAGGWATLQAPANAYFFDLTYEFDYFDGGDVVYVDNAAAAVQYLGYIGQGGNGADGYAIVRYFDKTSL